jgi:GNAT superfamily N-acetyltransferase
MIRLCSQADVPAIYEIINDSARAYKGVIPADVWHEPYMPLTYLAAEIGKGVQFHGYEVDGKLSGVMGIQDIKDVTLIRHAYVRGEARAHGIGRKLLEHVVQLTERPILIGAWRAASWAVRFYEKNGFVLQTDAEARRLFGIYWTIPERQITESVVLANARWRVSVV